MDENAKPIKSASPRIPLILIAIIIGALAGLATFRAAQLNMIKLGPVSSVPQNQPPVENKTIVNEENAVIDVVQNTSPSVVAIGSTQSTFNPYDPFGGTSQTSTIGSGFVVSDKGIIITNKHVVADTNATYNVITKDGKKLNVKKIYRDPTLDLAIVSVDTTNLPQALNFGDSSKLKVGQTVIAIGNALGQFTNTVTTGVVSGLGRQVQAGDPFSGSSENLDNLIQTDAAINPGNSGGPLLNSSGQVIGVNVATTQGAQNIGFAIPANSVQALVTDFETNGTISRPFLGVQYKFISKDLAIYYNYPPGAIVEGVIDGSAAQKAGIQTGDIIVKIDGKAVDSESVISDEIASKKVGDRVTLTIWNSGNQRDVTAILQEAPVQ